MSPFPELGRASLPGRGVLSVPCCLKEKAALVGHGLLQGDKGRYTELLTHGGPCLAWKGKFSCSQRNGVALCFPLLSLYYLRKPGHPIPRPLPIPSWKSAI